MFHGTYHRLEVWRQLVELVDGPYVDPAGVLVDHEVVELRTLLLWPGGPLVGEDGGQVATACSRDR